MAQGRKAQATPVRVAPHGRAIWAQSSGMSFCRMEWQALQNDPSGVREMPRTVCVQWGG